MPLFQNVKNNNKLNNNKSMNTNNLEAQFLQLHNKVVTKAGWSSQIEPVDVQEYMNTKALTGTTNDNQGLGIRNRTGYDTTVAQLFRPGNVFRASGARILENAPEVKGKIQFWGHTRGKRTFKRIDEGFNSNKSVDSTGTLYNNEATVGNLIGEIAIHRNVLLGFGQDAPALINFYKNELEAQLPLALDQEIVDKHITDSDVSGSAFSTAQHFPKTQTIINLAQKVVKNGGRKNRIRAYVPVGESFAVGSERDADGNFMNGVKFLPNMVDNNQQGSEAFVGTLQVQGFGAIQIWETEAIRDTYQRLGGSGNDVDPNELESGSLSAYLVADVDAIGAGIGQTDFINNTEILNDFVTDKTTYQDRIILRKYFPVGAAPRNPQGVAYALF